MILLIKKLGTSYNLIIMRVLFLNQHEFNENHGYLMRGVVNKLVHDNNEVEYICYKSNKTLNTNLDINHVGFRIKKIKMVNSNSYNFIIKVINMIYFSFYSLVCSSFRIKKYDVVIVGSSHILLLGFVGVIISKIHRAKFIYRVEDLTSYNYLINSNRIIKYAIYLYYLIEKFVYASSFKILTLSHDMKQTINNNFSKPLDNILIIPNLPKISNNVSEYIKHPILKKDNINFRIVFIGNIGWVQGLNFLIKSMKFLESENIELVILGSGSQEKKLKALSKKIDNKNVYFISFQSEDFSKQLVSTANMGVISLLPGIEKHAFPSKIYNYLEMYCPILGIVNKESELYNLIRDEGIGVAVEYGDTKKLTNTILDCANQDNFKNKFKNNIKKLTNSYFSSEKILNSWISAIYQK